MKLNTLKSLLLGLALSSTPAWSEMTVDKLYILHCSGCHRQDGKGVPEQEIPDLSEAGRYVSIPVGREYLIKVPGLSQSALNDAEAAQLLNYILNRFSAANLPANFKPYTAAEVTSLRSDKLSDAVVRRRQILAQLRERGELPEDYGTTSPVQKK